ncbi:RDD family protein [Rheinheimera pacifica]|uniref:RDD family protein n=1 Tax=Rheinheimera pacifica TaxID=173990 RepID=A0A1H6MY25_9GAMM|nr:RDD family protein [Rheinheimera pacifica]SEI07113.1 RDD family protein [Rheinheimera pacifica]
MSTIPPADNATISEVAPDTFVDSSGKQLTERQVRRVVTPHVFAVAPELIGKPLARPARRGVAILIDGFFIAALTSGSLIFLLPMLTYLAWSRWQAAKTGQVAILACTALVLFTSHNWTSSLPSDTAIKRVTDSTAVSANALRLSQADCDAACAQKQLQAVVQQLQKTQLSIAEREEMLSDLLDISQLSASEKASVMTEAITSLKIGATVEQMSATVQGTTTEPEPVTSITRASLWQRLQKSDHSILKWVQGILADLGIGFGWAIGYFTLFIAWNNGQTIGKKLCGIRVVQLDNKPISLWGAFGRQGGYSAGIATGLLGFLQVYWDPNRQAIQDKLADTLVIRL